MKLLKWSTLLYKGRVGHVKSVSSVVMLIFDEYSVKNRKLCIINSVIDLNINKDSAQSIS